MNDHLFECGVLSRSLRKKLPNQVTWMSYSLLLLLKKNESKAYWAAQEILFLHERDSRRSETRTNVFHTFIQPPIPTPSPTQYT